VLRTPVFAEVHEVGLFVAHGSARRLIGQPLVRWHRRGGSTRVWT